MPKLLIIGDLHGKKNTIDKCRTVLRKCKELAKETDYTVFLGDLNDTKANIRAEVQNLLLEELKDWSNPVYIIVGNHDYCNSLECKEHSLEALKLLENINIVDSMVYVDKLKAVFIPYMTESSFLELNIPKADVCFIHQDVLGAQYSNKNAIETKITPTLFKNIKQVFAGHIHLSQTVGNIFYVGTPYTESFNESDQEKYVVIYDGKTIEKIDLALPRHTTFTIDVKSIEDLKVIKKKLSKQIKEDMIVRLIINVSEELAPKIKRNLFNDLNIEQLKIKKVSNLTNNIRVKDNMSNNQIMESYINQLTSMTPEVIKLMLEWNKKIMEEK